MFYGPMAEQMRANSDLLWGLGPVAEALRQGDVLFGNFETPISIVRRNEPGAPDRYFSPRGVAKALKEFGYDVVNLAHNHIYDFGEEGVECTMNELREARLAFFGIGKDATEAAAPAVVTASNGMRLGFLGYTTAHPALDPRHKYVACFPDVAVVARHVQDLRPQVDAVIVSCHTGAQYNPYPAPETRALARAAIEAGASVFLGHHPHVSQGWERVSRGLALYSLGDFVAPVHTEDTRRTFFACIHLVSDRVTGHDIVPCYITDECRTVLADGELRTEIHEHMEILSRAIVEGRNDDLHFATAGSRFFSQYLPSWKEEFRLGGPKVFLRKLRNLRAYHVQLVVQAVLGKLGLKKRRSR